MKNFIITLVVLIVACSCGDPEWSHVECDVSHKQEISEFHKECLKYNSGCYYADVLNAFPDECVLTTAKTPYPEITYVIRNTEKPTI